jgi:hypothetical protein
MPKTRISEYSTTNSNNTDIESINIDEGCAPSGINNAIRELMVHLKEFQTGSSGDPLTVAGTFVASGGATLSGTNTLSGSTVMTASAGTSASPSIHFSSDTNTGIFSPAADTVAISAGGTNKAQFGTGSATIDGLTVGRGAGAVSSNTAVGSGALAATATGGSNTGVGYQTLAAVTSGDSNSAFGIQALNGNTTGANNTGIGRASLGNNTSGGSNVAVGRDSLLNNTTASNNTAVGYQAGYSITTGEENVCVGQAAGYTNTTGSFSVYVGRVAGYSTTGGFNTFVGMASGNLVTTGAKNTILGRYDGNQGGLDIRTASNYIVLSDGDGNPRGIFDNNGNFLVATTSTLLKTNRSMSFQVSGGCTQFISHSTADASGDPYIEFGYNATKIGSITQSGTTAVLYNTTSDQRLKENIQDAASASALIDALQVRQFDWKTDNTHQRYGFVAQELVTVAPEAVNQPTNPDEMMAVDYSKLVPMLVKEIQSLRQRLAALESN